MYKVWFKWGFGMPECHAVFKDQEQAQRTWDTLTAAGAVMTSARP